jgi:hypothetical protein
MPGLTDAEVDKAAATLAPLLSTIVEQQTVAINRGIKIDAFPDNSRKSAARNPRLSCCGAQAVIPKCGSQSGAEENSVSLSILDSVQMDEQTAGRGHCGLLVQLIRPIARLFPFRLASRPVYQMI